MTRLTALIGVLGLSFSAVFVRLAAVSPVTATFFRAAYALPLLVGLAWSRREDDRRPPRARLLAFASGVILALDLAFWHVSIARIGAGLATVTANVQVVFVALAAWALHRERPARSTIAVVVIVLLGLVLTSGLARPDAYGTAPVVGVIAGVIAGACYAGYLLTLRAANRTLAPVAGPLFESTLGAACGALLVAPFDRGFSLAPALPAHAWLVALAVVAQVVGWMLITTALPRLPAIETSILLLVQPVFALLWGVLFFREQLSPLQWTGASLVLAGVGAITGRNAPGWRAARGRPATG
jgi:drug/metabolite transporter (DMT)-like permease